MTRMGKKTMKSARSTRPGMAAKSSLPLDGSSTTRLASTLPAAMVVENMAAKGEDG